jgi:hypothetical protein
MSTNLVVIEGHALSIDTFERMLSIARSKGVKVGPDINPSSLDPVTTSLAKRIKKSKFNALLETMTDEQLKATAVALMFDTKVQKAVQLYHKSVVHYAQAASIAYQLDKRGIKIN